MNSSRRVFETFQKGMAYDYELWLKKIHFRWTGENTEPLADSQPQKWL